MECQSATNIEDLIGNYIITHDGAFGSCQSALKHIISSLKIMSYPFSTFQGALMGFNHLIISKGLMNMAEWGLFSLYLAIFGLPAAFTFGVMWARTGRGKQ